MRLSLKTDDPRCPYCGKKAHLKTSDEVYPHARQDYGMFWVCPGDCDAYVGTHKGGVAPLGRLANAELREWKKRAHRAFDPLWRDGGFSRQEAYAWLAQQMGQAKQVHIGWADVDDCRKIIEICDAGKD